MRAVLGREDHGRRGALAALADDEVAGGVEDVAVGGGGGRDARGRGDGDRRADDLPVGVVQRRHAGVVVRHAELAVGGLRDAPGVLEVRVGGGGEAGDVGDEVGLLVGAARERLEEVLVDEPGHRSALGVAGRDVEAEMIPAPDDAILRLGRRGREAGERVRLALHVLGRQAEADVVGAEEVGERRRGRAADAAVRGDPRRVVRRVVQRQPVRVGGGVGIAVLAGELDGRDRPPPVVSVLGVEEGDRRHRPARRSARRTAGRPGRACCPETGPRSPRSRSSSRRSGGCRPCPPRTWRRRSAGPCGRCCRTRPRSLTSLKPAVYSALVNAGGGPGRNCEPLSRAKGVTLGHCGVWAGAKAAGVGRQSPGVGPRCVVHHGVGAVGGPRDQGLFGDEAPHGEAVGLGLAVGDARQRRLIRRLEQRRVGREEGGRGEEPRRGGRRHGRRIGRCVRRHEKGGGGMVDRRSPRHRSPTARSPGRASGSRSPACRSGWRPGRPGSIESPRRPRAGSAHRATRCSGGGPVAGGFDPEVFGTWGA